MDGIKTISQWQFIDKVKLCLSSLFPGFVSFLRSGKKGDLGKWSGIRNILKASIRSRPTSLHFKTDSDFLMFSSNWFLQMLIQRPIGEGWRESRFSALRVGGGGEGGVDKRKWNEKMLAFIESSSQMFY